MLETLPAARSANANDNDLQSADKVTITELTPSRSSVLRPTRQPGRSILCVWRDHRPFRRQSYRSQLSPEHERSITSSEGTRLQRAAQLACRLE